MTHHVFTVQGQDCVARAVYLNSKLEQIATAQWRWCYWPYTQEEDRFCQFTFTDERWVTWAALQRMPEHYAQTDQYYADLSRAMQRHA